MNIKITKKPTTTLSKFMTEYNLTLVANEYGDNMYETYLADKDDKPILIYVYASDGTNDHSWYRLYKAISQSVVSGIQEYISYINASNGKIKIGEKEATVNKIYITNDEEMEISTTYLNINKY